MGKDALEELGFSKSHDNKSDVWKKGKKRKRIITRNQKSEWFVMLETYSVGNLEWFCDSFSLIPFGMSGLKYAVLKEIES